jgi:3-hydroxyacyl-CoA dehydrogenase/enoyl-CoA hydratase/carnithine racemase
MSGKATTRFNLTFSPSRVGRLAIVTMDNGTRVPSPKPNALGEAPLQSLSDTLDMLESESDVKGMMLTGMPFMFAAGADITTFEDADAEFARQGGEAGHAQFERISALPFPTLAAINGVALGGGLEIALHCDYRVLSTGAMMVAFPETFLGILPAWGGTQLTPRLIGARKALEVIVQNPLNNNTMLKPRQAFEIGLADRLYDSAGFHDAAIALLERLVAGDETVERSEPDRSDLDQALADARNFVQNKVHGATDAPYRAIELIEFAARGGDLAEGRRKEIDALAELLPSRQCKASIYAFDLTQSRVKKQPGKPRDVASRPIRKIAVIGAGLMGAQLGAYFLQRYEVPLVMKDINEEVLGNARQAIDGAVDKLVQRGRVTPGRGEFLKDLVTYTTSYDDVAASDLAIEAVLERMDIKKSIFADLERVMDDTAILATNTSSLSVAEMAADLQHPERVVGLHFFNPVSAMPLVEIIAHDRVSDEALATGYDIVKKLKKQGVGCHDAPGFIVNRLLIAFNGAATQALRHGNDFKEIDAAIKRLGVPMGPFELFGLVGLKVAFHTAETLAAAFPDRFTIDPNFEMIADSDLPGIYDWSSGGEIFPQIRESLRIDEGADKLTDDQIRSMALEVTAREIQHMLDDGVVQDARDIDTAMIFGAGFPFFMGGISKYLDQVGISEKVLGRTLVGETDQAFA